MTTLGVGKIYTFIFYFFFFSPLFFFCYLCILNTSFIEQQYCIAYCAQCLRDEENIFGMRHHRVIFFFYHGRLAIFLSIASIYTIYYMDMIYIEENENIICGQRPENIYLSINIEHVLRYYV